MFKNGWFRHVSESKRNLDPFFKPKLKPKSVLLNRIPERRNFGTYKPDDPTWESRCSCDDDGMAEPIIIYNEMMVKSKLYQYDMDLRNAKEDRGPIQ